MYNFARITIRGMLVLTVLLTGWQATISLFHLPDFILPAPTQVLHEWLSHFILITHEASFTLIEILAGLALGIIAGIIAALTMSVLAPVRYFMLPVILISQAIPTFAIAPLLVMWFGYGIASKIITTTIMLFFPITTALFDGIRQTPHAWMNMGEVMGASRFRMMRYVRFPAALPALASGIKVSAALAPIGAIVGEWVGASHGLGFLMLNANSRLQTGMMFACMFTLVAMTLALYFLVDVILKKLIPWQKEKS